MFVVVVVVVDDVNLKDARVVDRRRDGSWSGGQVLAPQVQSPHKQHGERHARRDWGDYGGHLAAERGQDGLLVREAPLRTSLLHGVHGVGRRCFGRPPGLRLMVQMPFSLGEGVLPWPP